MLKKYQKVCAIDCIFKLLISSVQLCLEVMLRFRFRFQSFTLY
jgi:hypothetical protein